MAFLVQHPRSNPKDSYKLPYSFFSAHACDPYQKGWVLRDPLPHPTCNLCLEAQGVSLHSLHEIIDTQTPTGKLTFHLFSALAEFEQNLIQERTQAGLTAARARGRIGGRPKTLDAEKRQLAIDLYNEKKMSVDKLCEMLSISKPTLYSYIRAAQTTED